MENLQKHRTTCLEMMENVMQDSGIGQSKFRADDTGRLKARHLRGHEKLKLFIDYGRFWTHALIHHLKLSVTQYLFHGQIFIK